MYEMIEKIVKSVSKEQRLSFISTFLIGVVTHLFMLSNKIPNHDDVRQLYDSMNRIRSGRWFLAVPSQISSGLSLPWFNGVLGILYISFCAMLLVRLFQVKSSICVIAISAIMVTFPTVASTFNYMSVGDSYFFGLLLACIAACIVTNSGSSLLCWFAAIALLTLSLGIYQAYLPFAAALLVIWHIRELLIEDKEVRQVLFSGIKCVCALGISITAYIIISKLVMKYHNMELIGHIAGFVLDDFSPQNIVRLAALAYYNSLGYFLINKMGVHYNGMNYLYSIVIIICLAFIVILFKKYNLKKNRMKNLLLTFLVIVFPLASGLIYCMCVCASTSADGIWFCCTCSAGAFFNGLDRTKQCCYRGR